MKLKLLLENHRCRVLLLMILILTCHSVAGQESSRRIKGQVTNEQKQVMVGVNVVVKGTNQGTTTDPQGNYNLVIPKETPNPIILEFTFLGYQQTNVHVMPSKDVYDVTLSEDAIALDEAIVVGYASQSKRSVTSAISSLKSDDLPNYAGSSIEQAIAGLVPGLRISTADATPGGDLDVQVRGIGTVTSGSQPLYIVDGIPLEGGLSGINPDDVDNIQILKDAASTAIYGSRGANGVILVTTKRGHEGKVQVSFSTNITISQAQRTVDVMNTPEILEYLEDSGVHNRFRYTTNSTQDFFPFDPNLNTNWQDLIFRNAVSQKYNVAISGGTKNISYRVSGEVFDQPGVLIYTGMTRYTVRANFDVRFSKKLKMSVNFSPSNIQTRKTREGGEGDNGVVWGAVCMYPFFPAVLPNGELFSLVEYNRAPTDAAITAGLDPITNQFSALQNNTISDKLENPIKVARDYQNRSKKNHITGAIAFDYTILPGLVFKPSFSIQQSALTQSEWYPSTLGKNRVDSFAASSSRQSLMWLSENILTYSKKISGHDITLVGGVTFEKNTTDYVYASANRFGTESLPNINGGTAKSVNHDFTDDRMLSYLARAGYSYRNKYLFTAIFRADGSTRFGRNNRFGYFPSVSAGWVISEENFLKNSHAISELKLRASWGVVGNNSIGQYNYANRLAQQNYILGNDQVSGWAPENIGNPDLKWEKSQQFNVGIDLGLLSNRIFLQADYYNTKTTDMLLNTIVPSTLGVGRMLQNIGSMRNKGIELSIVSRNLTNAFKWTTSFNIAFNRNKVLALGVDAEAIYDGVNESNVTKKGYPIGLFYGRVFKGIYQSFEEIEALRNDPYSGLAYDPNTRPGDCKWMDLNGNGEYDDDDRGVIGNPHPLFTAGMVNTFEYKNFTLSVQLNGQYGNDVYNYSFHQLLRGTDNNKSKLLVDRWRSPEQPGNGIADRATKKSDVVPAADKNKFTNRLLEDGSYLSIRNISLSYTLPRKVLEKWPISGLTVSFNVDNLHTFTNYSGLNPEASAMRRATAPGIDRMGYPLSRNYTMGVKLFF